MNPLPAQHENESTTSAGGMVPLTGTYASYSTANRRSTFNPAQRIYPWLLSISTLISAAFCLLYISKPVIVSSSGSGTSTENPAVTLAENSSVASSSELMPSKDRLPGEQKSSVSTEPKIKPSDPRSAPSGAPLFQNFEETNLRIQHILTAEAPGGHLDRIDIDVPVIYQSRNLRWTTTQAAEARKLMARLMDYQEKSLQLRAEGAELLDSWNRLIGSSIPAGDLRADSPTLPANQQDAADAPRPAGLTTTESIQIKTPEK